MKVYHITTAAVGDLIVSGGFRDSTGNFMTEREHTGVWVSDRPLLIEGNANIDDAACFELEIAEELLRGHEWIEDGKGYREWLVPAKLLNEKATTLALTIDEAFALI